MFFIDKVNHFLICNPTTLLPLSKASDAFLVHSSKLPNKIHNVYGKWVWASPY